jgi:nitrite reductase/ring-hydroxylating ferredoxin subunit
LPEPKENWMSTEPMDDCDECAGCPAAPSRRDFLGAAVRALATLGVAAGAASLPLGELRASVRMGATRSYPIPTQDGASIDRANEVILVRWQNAVYAFALSCPHQNTALRWQAGDGRFQCPKHHSQYRPDGVFIRGRATRGMDRFALRREGGAVLVDTDRLFRQTDDAAAWNAALVRL